METIQIKCQFCGQNFAVPSNFMGKTVECGGCDEPFEVTEDSFTKELKVYPGEKVEQPAKTFTKASFTTSTTANNLPVNFKTASYSNVSPEYAQPRKASKSFMIYLGVFIILVFIALFLFGGKEGGFLDNLDKSRRLVLTAFILLVGSSLIFVGFRRKTKAFLTILVIGGGLAAMPFLFPGKVPTPEEATLIITPIDTTSETSIDDNNSETSSEELEEYKRGIGFERIEQLRKNESDPNRIKAIILHDCKVQYLDTILPYLESVLSLDITPVTYSYGREIKGEPVTLITLVSDVSFEDLYEMTRKIGEPIEMNAHRSALKIIEVNVNKQALAPPPEEVTTNQLHANYFNVNFIELQSIDRSRQINAAKRLESGELLGRQADIAEVLANQITTTDHELSAQLIATLINWTRPEYQTDQKVLDYAQKIAGTKDMSQSVMNYLVEKDVPGSASILAKQWELKQGPTLWATHVIRAKAHGEEAIIKALPNVTKTHYKSAAAILTKIGTTRSIPAINTAISKANAEDKKYLKAVIDEINSRQ